MSQKITEEQAKEIYKQLKEVDNILIELYTLYRKHEGTDEEFALSSYQKAKSIIGILKNCGVKITFNSLTNRNYHFLVKLLNYNGFFKGKLNKSTIEELKKFKLLH